LNLNIENKTNDRIIDIDHILVSDVENYDWDCDSRPDKIRNKRIKAKEKGEKN
jgi:hypothetical protein